MATRQASQQLLLRRISGRIAVPSVRSPASRRLCTAAAIPTLGTSATASLRPMVTVSPSRWRSSNGVRWYSASNDNQVPGSRIWTFEEIKNLVESKKKPEEKVVIVDVREPPELLGTGKIPGAINIPITSAVQSFHISDADFEDMYGFARPPKDATLLFYCKAGVRAKGAAGLAQHAGWTSVGEYPGSWLDWDAQKGPIEKV